MTVSQLILLQCLTIAAGYDLRERRIPHALIYTYLCSGYFLSYRGTLTLPACFFCSSGRGVSYLLRYFLSLVMFRALASLTHAGGGDARLMALVIAWCGVDTGCQLLLPGLVLALMYLLWIRTDSGRWRLRERHMLPTLPLALPLLLGAIPGLIFSPASYGSFPYP